MGYGGKPITARKPAATAEEKSNESTRRGRRLNNESAVDKNRLKSHETVDIAPSRSQEKALRAPRDGEDTSPTRQKENRDICTKPRQS